MSDAHDGLIARLEETLTCQRYSRVVVHNYCRNARDFLSYLSERSIALEAVTPTQVFSQPAFPSAPRRRVSPVEEGSTRRVVDCSGS